MIPNKINKGINGQKMTINTVNALSANSITPAVISTKIRTVKPTARLTRLSPAACIFACKLAPGFVIILRQGANNVLSNKGAENALDVWLTRRQPNLLCVRQPSPYHHIKNCANMQLLYHYISCNFAAVQLIWSCALVEYDTVSLQYNNL